MIKIDINKFNSAKEKILSKVNLRSSIGVLSEKSVHSVLKEYLFLPNYYLEYKLDKKIADIFTGKKIIEIQSKNFDKLKSKLDLFLISYPVLVVYPVITLKNIITISEETGEILREKKSPKKGSIYDIFNEFYKIKPLLLNKNLSFHIIEITANEYRLDLMKKKFRKTHKKLDIIPNELINETYISSLDDIKKLLPNDLIDNFTSKELSKSLKINLKTAQNMLNVLFYLEIVSRTGKIKNSYTYTIK